MMAKSYRYCYFFMVIFYVCIIQNTYGTDNINIKYAANNIGVIGETYPIIETDFLDYLYARIGAMQKNGEWKSIQDHAKQSAVNYRNRPIPVAGMTRTTINKSWINDPSIILDHDVITPDGKLIAKTGTVINPLTFMPLSKTLIFYDSDDELQVKWVMKLDKKLNGKDKLILVNGSVLSQEKLFKRVIYFDQAGKLTTRFGITHVPAMVRQKNLHLTVMEVVP